MSAALVGQSIVGGAAHAENPTPTSTSSVQPGAAWMQQPDAAGLLNGVTQAQAEFEKAHAKQVRADKAAAELSKQITALQAQADAAALRIEQYARAAYIDSADSENLGALLTVFASGGTTGLSQAQQVLQTVGTIQSNQLQQDQAVIAKITALRQREQEIRADAQATMKQAQDRGQELLTKLGQLLGPAVASAATTPSTTATTCPKTAPAGSLTDGSESIGVKKLCEQSVKQARTPAAAAAIVWAFNHLGEPYNTGGVPIDVENFGSFNCATFVAKAFFWGARIPGFAELPWTPAYASPPSFVKSVGRQHKSGDINIMWRSGTMADSGGQAGHAQLFIADGWIIQSGGTGSKTNIARYPNGWGGWQEDHFSVAVPSQ